MEQNLIIYCDEIAEFLSAETLEKIDYGILDLSKIPDMNLKELLLFFEDVLTLELEVNYQKNNTGLFRVESLVDAIRNLVVVLSQVAGFPTDISFVRVCILRAQIERLAAGRGN